MTTPTFVQGVSGSAVFSGTSITVTITGVSAGSLILVPFALDSGTNTVTTVSDGVNSYTILSPTTGSGQSPQMGMAYALNSTSGSHTITLTTSVANGNSRAWAEEWSGVASAAALDGNNALFTSGSGSSGQTFNTGSFTTTAAGDLVWAASYNPNTFTAGAYTVGSGFTIARDVESASGYLSEFQIQGAAGAINPSFVTGIINQFQLFAVGAAFKAAGSGTVITSLTMTGVGV